MVTNASWVVGCGTGGFGVTGGELARQVSGGMRYTIAREPPSGVFGERDHGRLSSSLMLFSTRARA